MTSGVAKLMVRNSDVPIPWRAPSERIAAMAQPHAFITNDDESREEP